MTDTTCQSTADMIVRQLGNQFVAERLDVAGFGIHLCAVRTPFLYPDNTPIVVYVETDGDQIVLTDRGDAADYAFLSGIGDRIVKGELDRARARLNLRVDRGAICFTATTEESVGEGIGYLLTAIQRISALAVARRQRSRSSDFAVSIEEFITARQLKFRRDQPLRGANDEFKVDYAIEDMRGHVQLYLWAFDPAPSKADSRMHDLFYWYTDWKTLQSSNTTEADPLPPLRVLANTTGQKMQSTQYVQALDSLRTYYPELVVPWQEREQLTEIRAA